MGEYDVTIRNKSNGTETTVTVKTANSTKAAENVSVAATAVSAVENEVENKVVSSLTKNNVYGKPAKTPSITRKTQKNLNKASLNSEKSKMMNKIKSLESSQNQEELETFRKKVSNAKTMNQLTQLSTQINSMNTPPEPVSITEPAPNATAKGGKRKQRRTLRKLHKQRK